MGVSDVKRLKDENHLLKQIVADRWQRSVKTSNCKWHYKGREA